MSGYKTFAVLGTGSIGAHIIDALSKEKTAGVINSVTVLTRSAKGHEDLVSKGVNAITVDYSSPSSVKAALCGIDVVISALGYAAIPLEGGIAEIAKDTGVKLFVPSNWTSDIEDKNNEQLYAKVRVKEKLEEIGLPYATFYTGGWTDWYFGKDTFHVFGIDIANGKGDVCGSGEASMSFTSRRDVGRYVAHVLTALPRDKIEWRAFRIEAERTSLNRILADWEAHCGKKLALTYHPRSEFEEALARNPNDIYALLTICLLDGKGVAGKPEEITNYEWPEWNPQKVIDTLIELYN